MATDLKASVSLNPNAREFIPASLLPPSEFLPASLYPPSEFTPTFQNHNFLHHHLPPPPPFFNHNFPCHPLIHKPTKMIPFYPPTKNPTKVIPFYTSTKKPTKKPTKVYYHGNGKTKVFCNRRCLPPRLVKKKEAWVTKNRKLSAKVFPVEDKAVTFLAGRTSLMVKNIPNGYGRSDLLKILDIHCCKENQKAAGLGYDHEPNPSSYDFLYLPMDFVRRGNLGYAFVNFTSSIAAVRFCKEFDNYVWTDCRSNKTCKITIAKCQGKEALSHHFKESKFPCHSDEYLPVVLSPPSDGFTGYNLKTLGYRVGGASRRT